MKHFTLPASALLLLIVAIFILPGTASYSRTPNLSCSELLVNGDTEQNEGWNIPLTPITAQYSTEQAHSGNRSIRIGIVNAPNLFAYSSARQQVTVPSTTVTITLRFWLYPVATSAQMALPAPVLAQQPAGGDAQYLLVLDENLNVLEVLLWTLENSQAWQEYTFDLDAYAGETIWLHFGVYNDGADGVTGMYLDDVSLLGCEPLPQPGQVYLPLISNGEAEAGPLLIDGDWASQVIGHPQSQTIYALTPNGLYRSDDNAATWALTGSLPPVSHTILLAPGEPAVLYGGEGFPCLKGGEDRPLWKSVDSGQTWSELSAGLNLEPLAVHPDDSQRVYARGCDGPYLTTDGGASWQLQGDELFGTYEARFAAPVFADDWKTVYLGGVTEGGGGSIISSQDGGVNWALVTPLKPAPWAITAMPSDPLPPNEIYFAEPNALWGTHDGGATWYTSTAGLEGVIYDPGAPISQTYGLLSLTVSPGADWLLGTVSGLYRNVNPAIEAWSKITGHVWQDDSITALLRRLNEPQQIFVTTPAGVYIYQREDEN